MVSPYILSCVPAGFCPYLWCPRVRKPGPGADGAQRVGGDSLRCGAARAGHRELQLLLLETEMEGISVRTVQRFRRDQGTTGVVPVKGCAPRAKD